MKAAEAKDAPDRSLNAPFPASRVRLVVDASGRIPALDGLRGIACALVVLQHFGPQIASETGVFAFLKSAPRLVFGGVDLFFVLSGFLIGGILFEVRPSTHYYRTFYIRRFFRLFPLYYLSILSYLACRSLYEGTPFGASLLFQNALPVWPYWLHLQNFSMAIFDTFGALWLAGSWSLAVEEQFYLLLPPLVRRVSGKTVARLCCIAWLGSLVLRLCNAKLGLLSPLTGGFVLIPFRLDGLAIGVLIAYAIRFEPELVSKTRRLWPIVALATALVWLAYPYVTSPSPQLIRLVQHSVNSILFGSTLLSVLLFPTSAFGKLLSLRPMRTLGNWSYHIYLSHQVVLYSVFHAYTGNRPVLATSADLIPMGITLVTILCLAALSWRFLEKPLLAIGHRFQY